MLHSSSKVPDPIASLVGPVIWLKQLCEDEQDIYLCRVKIVPPFGRFEDLVYFVVTNQRIYCPLICNVLRHESPGESDRCIPKSAPSHVMYQDLVCHCGSRDLYRMTENGGLPVANGGQPQFWDVDHGANQDNNVLQERLARCRELTKRDPQLQEARFDRSVAQPRGASAFTCGLPCNTT